MGVRFLHDHPDGGSCFVVAPSCGRWPYTRPAVFGFTVNGEIREFTAAYLPYTGSWYAFDLKTGKEMATFDREFFEEFIAPFRATEEMQPAPECDVRATA